MFFLSAYGWDKTNINPITVLRLGGKVDILAEDLARPVGFEPT